MNHKKSMRIFWLSLCLLLVSGAVIIAVAQSRAHKKAADTQDAAQKDMNARLSANTAPEADAAARQASVSVQDQTQPSTASGAQVQQTNGGVTAYIYELKINDGYLEVYYYHTQDLFLHTGIASHTLTAEQMQDVQKGKYFRDEEELYGYLESCTS